MYAKYSLKCGRAHPPPSSSIHHISINLTDNKVNRYNNLLQIVYLHNKTNNSTTVINSQNGHILTLLSKNVPPAHDHCTQVQKMLFYFTVDQFQWDKLWLT